MKKSFEEALKHRRTYYSITNQSPVSDEEIERIVNLAVTHVPSAFNSQSTRVVLLLGENHKKLWHIVKETLRKIVPPEVFKTTEAKIDNSLQADTELFYSSKISRSLRDCRKHSAVIRITSRVVAADFCDASAGCMDDVGRCRLRSFFATLQSADR